MPRLVFHLIPHTHWDREWYLPRAAFGARLVLMMDDLVDRLERDAGFRSFLLDGQASLVADYLGRRPEALPRLEALARDGRLQIGPWYVLADEQIPSGESLVRNLLLGRAVCERVGRRTDVVYSPDAFGHPAMLPDLAREFGLPYGVLWRGMDHQVADGRDLVRWRGPGGGEVVVYHLPPAGYEVGSSLFARADVRRAWRQMRSTLVARAASPHIAVFLGADHHWAHPAVARLREELALLEPEHEVRVSRLDEFLRLAAGSVAAVPVVTGELRWSYGFTWTLQGVHGTRAPLKRKSSALELLIERVAEPLAALVKAPGLGSLLDAAWRAVIESQFHDAICGCSSDSVAREVDGRLDGAAAIAREVARRAVHRLVGHVPDRARDNSAAVRPRLVLWNPAARPRRGVIVADTTWFRRDVLVGPPGGREPRRGPGARPFHLVGPDGRQHPVQLIGRGVAQRRLDTDRHYPDQDEVDVARVAISTLDLPALGFAILEPSETGARPRGNVFTRGGRLGNELIEVSIGLGGSIDLLDRVSDERYPGLLRLEDEADAGDTYTFSRGRPARFIRSTGPVRTRVLAAGPLVGVVESRWAMPNGRIELRLVVRVHAGSPLVHCRLEVDNRATDHRLRARLPLRLGGAELVTGTQFGAVRRGAVRFDSRDYPDETPVSTAPMHRFAGAARGKRGLGLLLPGFAEIEWTDRGDLLLTLLRAVGELSRADLAARPGHAGWPEPTPLAQCLGRNAIELALAPVPEAALDRPEQLVELWEDAFLAPQAFWLPDAMDLHLPPDGIALEGDGLVCSAVKPAADGVRALVVRCYNARARPVEGRWRFELPRARAWRVRADERGHIEATLHDAGRVLPFRAEPLAWVTHLVR